MGIRWEDLEPEDMEARHGGGKRFGRGYWSPRPVRLLVEDDEETEEDDRKARLEARRAEEA